MIDAQAVIKAINAATEAVTALRETLDTRTPAGRPAKNAAPPAPVDLGKLSHIHLIESQIAGWMRVTEDETGDPLDTETSTYLLRHAGFIAAQRWAPDMIEELRDSARKAVGMTGSLPRRSKIGTTCQCGAERHLYYRDGDRATHEVICRNGHVSTAADAMQGKTAKVSLRGAERLLGVRRQTLTDAIRNDALRNHGTETRPLVDTEEVQAYLRARLMAHNM